MCGNQGAIRRLAGILRFLGYGPSVFNLQGPPSRHIGHDVREFPLHPDGNREFQPFGNLVNRLPRSRCPMYVEAEEPTEICTSPV